jgi:hypothetical protein
MTDEAEPTDQRTDAAERSAHVLRGGAPEPVNVLPVVEVSPGVWRLRVLVELEAENARLRARIKELEG